MTNPPAGRRPVTPTAGGLRFGRGPLVAVLLALASFADGAARGDELAATLEKRVEEVLAGDRPLTEVRLEVVGGRPNRRSLVVWGSGVGVWNQEKQFVLAPEEHRELLRRVLAAGWFEMPERPRPERKGGPSPDAPVIIRSVGVRVGELERIVAQNDRVWMLPELEALVTDLFALCEKPASKGRGASSLTDGLAKIAKGELALETLQLVLNLPPVAAGSSGGAANGVLVVLDGAVPTWTEQEPGRPGVAVPVTATSDRLRSLVDELAGSGLEGLPVNLYRTRYVDLNVRVLGHARTVQARAFAGMDPAKHAAAQEALERVIRSILALGPGAPGSAAGGGR